MYLRLGWVVGNAGFGGAILIILLAKLVTVTTGLAISSLTTNIKIGAGGSYALVSRSLGAEVGSAIGISLIIYIAVAFWLDRLASAEALVQNYTIMMDISRWRVFIVAGVLGATLSSALGSIVGGPRTLMALGQDKVVPFARLLARQSINGEPRYAILFTVVVIEVSLLLGDLNTIAPLLTMFFLITYGTINLAVVIEKSIKIP